MESEQIILFRVRLSVTPVEEVVHTIMEVAEEEVEGSRLTNLEGMQHKILAVEGVGRHTHIIVMETVAVV